MESINEFNPTLEESLSLENIALFESFDIEKFLEGKILAVEKVLVDAHIKLEARIVEDNTLYEDNDKNLSNQNKVITCIIDDSIAEFINIVNIIGKQVTVGNLANAKASIVGRNALNVIVDDIDILDHKIPDFKQRPKLNKADYRLVKTNGFKCFDHNKFLDAYQMKLLTIYPQTPKVARAIILITDTKYDSDTLASNIMKAFSIKLEMDDVRDIPIALLYGTKSFDASHLVGQVTSTVVKNNHVLLMAEQLVYHDEDQILSVGHTQ